MSELEKYKDYKKRQQKDPRAYVLTYCKYGKDGKVVEKKSTIY